MTEKTKPSASGWARTINLFDVGAGDAHLPAWTEVSPGSGDIPYKTLFDHLAAIEDDVRAGLGKLGLGNILTPSNLFEVRPLSKHRPGGLNTYACSLLVSPGLGVMQPLVSFVSVGTGIDVDVSSISNAIVAEARCIWIRRSRHAATCAQIRRISAEAIDEAAADGIGMELLAVQATAYVPDRLAEGDDHFEVVMLMLDERDGRIESDGRRLNVDDPVEFARRMRTLVIPEQRNLTKRLARQTERPSH